MLRRSFIAATALLAFAVPATAAGDDPVALVRELYRVHGESEKTKQRAWQPPHRDRFFSRNLARLIARAQAKNGIDFDFIYDGQDFQITELDFALVRSAGGKARVEARFKNFGEPQRLAYDLVREGGAWRVADIRAVKKGGWVLTKLLAKR